MMDILFLVKVDLMEGEQVRVVGSLPELGIWSPSSAPSLTARKGNWESIRFRVAQDCKFEFKLIKIKQDGSIQWQQLPNNSNRKFKAKSSSKLHLQWSQPSGSVTALNRSSFKVKGLPAAMLSRSQEKLAKSMKRQEQFDPYKTAQREDSGSQDEQEFVLVKRRMSDEITVDSGDLEEIFYNSNPLEIFSGLLKKLKVYVISKEIDAADPFQTQIEQQLQHMPPNYLVKWITADCLINSNKSRFCPKFVKRNSIFEIKDEQIHIESLYSRTSYFLFLEIETVLKLQSKVDKVPTCLYLPAASYQQVIENLAFLTKIQLICFDDAATNRNFYEYLEGKNQGEVSSGEEWCHLLNKQVPSIEAVVEQLKSLKYRDTVMVNTLVSISESEALHQICHQNIVTIIDSKLIRNSPAFVGRMVSELDSRSMLIIVEQGEELEKGLIQYRECKNVVIVFDNFEKAIVEGKEYNPLRKFKETLSLFRMKSELFLRTFGGVFSEKQNSMIYNLPEGKEQWAAKVESECRHIAKHFGFIRITRKGTRVKITWNLAHQARLIRTLCELKYTTYGLLGNFHIVSDCLSLRYLKDDLRLLIEHKPKLFMANGETKVRYYSYGGNQTATCHILPEQSPI